MIISQGLISWVQLRFNQVSELFLWSINWEPDLVINRVETLPFLLLVLSVDFQVRSYLCRGTNGRNFFIDENLWRCWLCVNWGWNWGPKVLLWKLNWLSRHRDRWQLMLRKHIRIWVELVGKAILLNRWHDSKGLSCAKASWETIVLDWPTAQSITEMALIARHVAHATFVTRCSDLSFSLTHDSRDFGKSFWSFNHFHLRWHVTCLTWDAELDILRALWCQRIFEVSKASLIQTQASLVFECISSKYISFLPCWVEWELLHACIVRSCSLVILS